MFNTHVHYKIEMANNTRKVWGEFRTIDTSIILLRVTSQDLAPLEGRLVEMYCMKLIHFVQICNCSYYLIFPPYQHEVTIATDLWLKRL